MLKSITYSSSVFMPTSRRVVLNCFFATCALGFSLPVVVLGSSSRNRSSSTTCLRTFWFSNLFFTVLVDPAVFVFAGD